MDFPTGSGTCDAVGVKPVTLGKRILRTETAGMFVMAAVGLLLE
ncbi:MAG: 16S rRNA (uracil(1498)-N(3))-methyltransferase [Pilosibacter sp.]